MSVAINNLLNFSRELPAPLDKLASKKVKVSSKYGSGTEATLTCTVVKAVHALCDCMTGICEGAVGVIDHRMVAEYKSSAGPDAYHLVVYDSVTGNILASGYDKNTEMVETYRLHQTANDGAAVLMAMMPALLSDQEFDDNFQIYLAERKNGYLDLNKATEAMAIMDDGTEYSFSVSDGAKGDKGDNAYVHFRFASQKPTSSSSSMGTEPDDWIGFYSGNKSVAPTDPMEYVWAPFKGATGKTGSPAKLTSAKLEYQVGTPSSIVWHRLTPLRTIGDLTLFLPCTRPSVSTRRATPSGLSPSAHMTHTTPGTLSSTRTSSTGR